MAVQAARMGRTSALRPRKDHDCRGTRGRERLRPLSRRRRRRDPLPYAASVHAKRGAISPAGLLVTAMRATAKRATTTSIICSACCANSKPQRVCAEARRARLQTEDHFGVIYYGSTSAAMAEALAALERQGLHLDTLRVRAFPFSEESSSSSMLTTRCSWSSRTGTPSFRNSSSRVHDRPRTLHLDPAL